MIDPDLLDEVMTARQREMRTCMPAKVLSYDAGTQTVEVEPQFKIAYPTGEGGTKHQEIAVIPDVPVCFPRVGGFFIALPIQKGDFVLLVFAERSLQAWRTKGQKVEPGDKRMHRADGAIAIPGVFPDSGALADAHATNMRMGRDGTPAAQIEITSSEIRAGQGATKFVAMAAKVNARLDTLQAKYDGHKHTETGATTSVPDLIVGPLASVASSNLKAND